MNAQQKAEAIKNICKYAEYQWSSHEAKGQCLFEGELILCEFIHTGNHNKYSKNRTYLKGEGRPLCLCVDLTQGANLTQLATLDLRLMLNCKYRRAGVIENSKKSKEPVQYCHREMCFITEDDVQDCHYRLEDKCYISEKELASCKPNKIFNSKKKKSLLQEVVERLDTSPATAARLAHYPYFIEQDKKRFPHLSSYFRPKKLNLRNRR